MECFLHIGTEKTATTTLQQFLNLNRQKLLECNLLYTKSAGVTNNRALSVAAYNLNRVDDYTKSLSLDTESKLYEHQEEVINKLKEEISVIYKTNPHVTLLFSSEHFQSRLTTIEEVEKLKKILHELGATNIYVVIYLRRPAEIANSLYSTIIKAGGVIEQPPLPDNLYMNNICNHKKTLKRFSCVFGKSFIIPRLFDENEFYKETIIDDFLNAINLNYKNISFRIPDNENVSLSSLGIYVLRKLNHSIPKFINNKPNPLRSNLVPYIEKNIGGSKYIMPSYLYKTYDLEFQKSNEWVMKKYFYHKRQLFKKDIPKESTYKTTEKELDGVIKCISDIWIDKQKQVNDLESHAKYISAPEKKPQ